MQVRDFYCQTDGHKNSDLEYLCTDGKCKLQKLCCFHCMKQFHKEHIQNIVELDVFLGNVSELSNQLQNIKFLIKGLYIQIVKIFNRIQEEITYLDQLYIKYSDQMSLKKIQTIEPIDSFEFFLIARQTIQKFQMYVDQFDSEFFLIKQKREINKTKEQQAKDINIQKAVVMMKNKQFEAAIFYIEQSLKEDATNSEALSLKSSCLLNLNYDQEALQIAKVSYILNPSHLNNLMILARIHIKKKEYRTAYRYIVEGLKIDEKNTFLLQLRKQIPDGVMESYNIQQFNSADIKKNYANMIKTTEEIDLQKSVMLKKLVQLIDSDKTFHAFITQYYKITELNNSKISNKNLPEQSANESINFAHSFHNDYYSPLDTEKSVQQTQIINTQSQN